MMHEAQLHQSNYFLTLTLNEEAINEHGWSLQPKYFTDFAKRTRAKMGPFRYYMVGEYGTRFLRPHYHAAAFGLQFNDLFPLRKSESGHQLYESDTLSKLWPWGEANIGALTFESAAYMARYMMDKPTTDAARQRRYERVDGDTGEITEVLPEFCRISNGGSKNAVYKGGIGKQWIEKFHTDVYPGDFVISRSRQAKPPRYYDEYYKEIDQHGYENIKNTRRAKAKLNKDDNTPARLQVKEELAKAALQRKARQLE